MTGKTPVSPERASRTLDFGPKRFLSAGLLVAGLSDKNLASGAFPLLDRVRSYPTTIFMHADGRVRAVHQGYAGPATGEANRKLRERFRHLIEELLAEPTADQPNE